MKNALPGLLIFCISFCGTLHAQYTDDLERADSLIQIQEFGNAISILNRLIEQKPNRYLLSQTYFQLSRANLGLGNFEKAAFQNEQSLSIKNNLHYEFIADNYLLFGLIEMQKGDNDKALDYFFKAVELPYESIEFSGLLYAYIAQVYYRKNDVKEVLKYYSIAMESLLMAFEEADVSDRNHYRIRGNRLYYDRFFIGFL